MKGDKNAASSLLNRDRLGLSLKTELSDRILINGKIGVPVSGVEDNAIIGDVQIDFLLNQSGTLKARVFNRRMNTNILLMILDIPKDLESPMKLNLILLKSY